MIAEERMSGEAMNPHANQLQFGRAEMRRARITIAAAVLTVGVILGTIEKAEAATDAQKCAGAKMNAAAKYAACRLGADKKGELNAEPADYTKCDAKQATGWAKIETKYGVQCPTSGDQSGVQSDVAAMATCLAGNVSSTGTPVAVQVDCLPCPVDGVVLDGACWILELRATPARRPALEGMSYDDALTNSYAGPTDGIGHCYFLLDQFGAGGGNTWHAAGQGPPNCGCSYDGGRWVPGLATPQCAFAGVRRVCACN
jgi:hypothetical protein